jgi:hypothetical protein
MKSAKIIISKYKASKKKNPGRTVEHKRALGLKLGGSLINMDGTYASRHHYRLGATSEQNTGRNYQPQRRNFYLTSTMIINNCA